MTAVSLASLQHCRSVDSDAWCKRTLTSTNCWHLTRYRHETYILYFHTAKHVLKGSLNKKAMIGDGNKRQAQQKLVSLEFKILESLSSQIPESTKIDSGPQLPSPIILRGNKGLNMHYQTTDHDRLCRIRLVSRWARPGILSSLEREWLFGIAAVSVVLSETPAIKQRGNIATLSYSHFFVHTGRGEQMGNKQQHYAVDDKHGHQHHQYHHQSCHQNTGTPPKSYLHTTNQRTRSEERTGGVNSWNSIILCGRSDYFDPHHWKRSIIGYTFAIIEHNKSPKTLKFWWNLDKLNDTIPGLLEC